MDRIEAEKALKASRANVCAVPLMNVPQPFFDRASFVRLLKEDKKESTIFALLDFVSSQGGLAGIPNGVNRYIDRYREHIARGDTWWRKAA